MPPRIHIATPLQAGAEIELPANASRHVQVLRLQPGAALTLFDGSGGEWSAEVLAMGRKSVSARALSFQTIERELATPVTLALGMPANERMDTLVEKATELGVTRIVPLVCERSVLRVAGERAERKAAHWQAIAVAACEQSGRNRLPQIDTPMLLRDWLTTVSAVSATDSTDLTGSTGLTGLTTAAAAATAEASVSERARLLLSLADGAWPLAARRPTAGAPLLVLSGPEGGLSPAELAAAQTAGFIPVSLGPRVLRADTAPLAVLACIAGWESLV